MGKNKFYRSPQTYMYAWRMFATIIRFSFVYYARAHLLRRYSFAVSLSLSSSMSLCFILIRIVNIFLWFLLFCFFFVAACIDRIGFFSILTAKVLKILRLWGTNFVWKREIRSVHVILSFLLSSLVYMSTSIHYTYYILCDSFWLNPHCLVAPYHCAYRIL